MFVSKTNSTKHAFPRTIILPNPTRKTIKKQSFLFFHFPFSLFKKQRHFRVHGKKPKVLATLFRFPALSLLPMLQPPRRSRTLNRENTFESHPRGIEIDYVSCPREENPGRPAQPPSLRDVTIASRAETEPVDDTATNRTVRRQGSFVC